MCNHVHPRKSCSELREYTTHSLQTTIQDLIQIKPQELNKPSAQAIKDAINTKYSNRVIPNIGLCICLFDLLETTEGLIGHGTGLVNVNGKFAYFFFILCCRCLLHTILLHNFLILHFVTLWIFLVYISISTSFCYQAYHACYFFLHYGHACSSQTFSPFFSPLPLTIYLPYDSRIPYDSLPALPWRDPSGSHQILYPRGRDPYVPNFYPFPPLYLIHNLIQSILTSHPKSLSQRKICPPTRISTSASLSSSGKRIPSPPRCSSTKGSPCFSELNKRSGSIKSRQSSRRMIKEILLRREIRVGGSL